MENEEHVNKRQYPGKVDNEKLIQPPSHIWTCVTRIARKVLVIGYSLPIGTEGLICCPDISPEKFAAYQEVAFIMSLLNPTDYLVLLLFHVGYNNTVTP